MKKNVLAAYLQKAEQRRRRRKLLATERARIKLPYKPARVTEEELKEAVAKLPA